MFFDPIILFFVTGIVAKVIIPKLRLPQIIHTYISLFLLISIGLKGGLELCSWASWSLLVQIVAVFSLSIVTCFICIALLQQWSPYQKEEIIVIAGHYGSVSVGTFAVAIAMLQHAGIEYEPYMPLFVALMEFPAIIITSILLKKSSHGNQSILLSTYEAITCKSVSLLLLSIAVGYMLGPMLVDYIRPLFFDTFKGALAIFLVEMGILVGDQFKTLLNNIWTIVPQAIGLSLICSILGLATGLICQLSLGGITLLMVLAASASYIAVPAVLRSTWPQVNVPLALSFSLGATFPFNIFLGIYLYLYTAQWIVNYFDLETAVTVCIS